MFVYAKERYRGSKSAIMRWSFFITLKLPQRQNHSITYPLQNYAKKADSIFARSRVAFARIRAKKAMLSFRQQRQKSRLDFRGGMPPHATACHSLPRHAAAKQSRLYFRHRMPRRVLALHRNQNKGGELFREIRPWPIIEF